MVAALISMTLTAAPLQLAVPSFEGQGLTAEQLGGYSEFFRNQLRLAGVQVKGETELQPLGAERLAALKHCVADACGSLADVQADALVQGTMLRVSEGYQLDVKVLDTATAQPLAVRSARSVSEDEGYELLRQTARQVAIELFTRTGREPVHQPEAIVPQTQKSFVEPMDTLPGALVMLAGAAALGTGIALNTVARGQLADVSIGFHLDSYPEAQARAQGAKNLSLASFIAMTAGGAIALAGVIWTTVAVAHNRKVSTFAWLDGQGGGIGLTAVWP